VSSRFHIRSRPNTRQDKERDTPDALRRIRQSTDDFCHLQPDIERDVQRPSKDQDRSDRKGLSNIHQSPSSRPQINHRTHNEATQRSIFHHLRRDDSISEESPEGGGDRCSVESGEDGEDERALFEDGGGGEELEGECQRVEAEEDAELNSS